MRVPCEAAACQRPWRFTNTSVQIQCPLVSLPLYELFSSSLPVTIAVSPKTRTFMSPSVMESSLLSPDLRSARASALGAVPVGPWPTQSSARILSRVATSFLRLASVQSCSICFKACSTPAFPPFVSFFLLVGHLAQGKRRGYRNEYSNCQDSLNLVFPSNFCSLLSRTARLFPNH